MWRAALIAVAALTACAEFPQVDTALAEGNPDLDYPDLLPFERLLDGAPPRLDPAEDENLRARADAVRARADNLRGPVIEPETRGRMEDGVTPR
ncbi:hypothetical protein [Marivita sp. GX14005]|uniref:hypothetical protein n=1 Tax=Marivita sp. GX14005 TaxID=2942276 RepID=UPI002019BFCB|nr:hypothetical protein [Marivita sp. GX14005]MCL3881112.1 hypothetical protein [Marivita sp. GX14005]